LEVSSQDKLCFDVVFTEEYISPYMVTKKYFKKVRLDILYKLNSIYSKKMYIFLKDYAGFDKKTNKNDISMFLGMAYNKNKIKSYLLEINNNSDIIVGLEKPKHGKKSDIKFTIENQDYFANEAERYDHDLNKWVHERMMEDCRRMADTDISNGKVVESYGAYVDGIYKRKKDKENQFQIYESIYNIEQYILHAKEKEKDNLDQKKENPMLVFKITQENDDVHWFIIDDNYQLVNFSLACKVVTSDVIKIYSYLLNQAENKNIWFGIHYSKGKNEDWSMMYF
jgi:plasmid replication initiation protein